VLKNVQTAAPVEELRFAFMTRTKCKAKTSAEVAAMNVDQSIDSPAVSER
jgi:hypothetical protein